MHDESTRSTIVMMLDQQRLEISDVRPDTTLLNYLRGPLARTGTKEGCAEGDCGACTVVVADTVHDAKTPRYRAVNACIQLLPTLDGKQLYTIESLKQGNVLHPIQQAMVDQHASQCGFCTPGFVMSLFALYKSQPQADRQKIQDTLAGNLCRCTGYHNIVKAVQAGASSMQAVPCNAKTQLNKR